MADGYILDGMGHQLVSSNSTMTIGKMRDVYISYTSSSTSNGITTYTYYQIYIRPDGTVCLVDPETYQETPTDYNVNNMTKNPFTIDLKTGRLY